jgi:predicted RNA-binding Zn-ribbon protein involved in translation (DUF1610 family)
MTNQACPVVLSGENFLRRRGGGSKRGYPCRCCIFVQRQARSFLLNNVAGFPRGRLLAGEHGVGCMSKAEIFVNQENMALFNCPHCGKMKHVSVAQFKDKKHSLQVKCVCGQTFAADLNFRKKYRKQTKLAGYFCKTAGAPSEIKQLPRNCTIVNLSLGGMGLRHETALKLAVGDELRVDFVLDDRKQSHMERKIIVRHVGADGYIGGEFCDTNQHAYEKTLGFYLMP